MKKIVALIIFVVVIDNVTRAQTPPAIAYASKVTDRMSDSLNLAPNQREKLYKLNIELSNQMMQAFRQSNNRDSVGRSLQRIENTRDSLYGTVLTKEQFDKYKLKKGALLNNN